MNAEKERLKMENKISKYAEIITIIGAAVALYFALSNNMNLLDTRIEGRMNSLDTKFEERMTHMDSKWFDLFKIYLEEKDLSKYRHEQKIPSKK